MKMVIPAQPGWLGLYEYEEGIGECGTVIGWIVDISDPDDVTPISEYGECHGVVSPRNTVTMCSVERWHSVAEFLHSNPNVMQRTRALLANLEAKR